MIVNSIKAQFVLTSPNLAATNSGSVAIGPGTPSYKLHVTENSSNTGTTSAYFDFLSTTSGNQYSAIEELAITILPEQAQ